eukprot:CAMPEP_0195539810 /NCGR_PEP_ID=MMETSP0794_2-20130614/50249_1 /TAXON_ID=515487 /ORGANISM="Stephanopyxis turris, Strain CCMP 815" /LENGTH=990 /DNA_ID=CAMNT_0040673863 /DNA_START=668 /DNA_END=3636 /DNA_ORIENTATION=-
MTDPNDEQRDEYEVLIKPHPDFGIGLRLEEGIIPPLGSQKQTKHLPAIAASYKKHPLSGGRLPAERSGMIVLGDALIAVNNESLLGMAFEEVIAAVRCIGAKSAGKALRMRFRPGSWKKVSQDRYGHNKEHIPSHIGQEVVIPNDAAPTYNEDDNKQKGHTPHRSIEEIMNITTKGGGGVESSVGGSSAGSSAAVMNPMLDDGSAACTLQVGAEEETQQEFGRIIAVIRDGLLNNTVSEPVSCSILLPWNEIIPSSYTEKALLVTIQGQNTLSVGCLELVSDDEAVDHENNATCSFLGMTTVESYLCDAKSNDATITSLTKIEISSTIKNQLNWSVLACDSTGATTLIFITMEHDNNDKNKVSFRQFPIFQSEPESILSASSIDCMATYTPNSSKIKVWTTLPNCEMEGNPSKTVTDTAASASNIETCATQRDKNGEYYYTSTIIDVIVDATNHDNSHKIKLLDVRFQPSGSLDAHPWLVAFTTTSAITYRRSGGTLTWNPIVQLHYSQPLQSGSPADIYPHLLPTLTNIILDTDESNYQRGDYHPDSLLALISTETKGCQALFKAGGSIQNLYLWLSRWVSPDETERPKFGVGQNDRSFLQNKHLPAVARVAPLSILNDTSTVGKHCEAKDDEDDEEVQNAANLMATLMGGGASLSNNQLEVEEPNNEEDSLLSELQKSLDDHRNLPPSLQSNKNQTTILPKPLKSLSRQEIHVLWAIGQLLAQPPNYKRLDAASQLALCAIEIHKHLITKHEKQDDDPHSTNDAVLDRHKNKKLQSFCVFSSTDDATKNSQKCIPSGAALSALLSNTQSKLLSRCKPEGKKMDWATARRLMIPFWLRDINALRSLCEEIAKEIFVKTRDVMECALLYVAMRNKIPILMNLARTDDTLTGKKFLQFLQNHDFQSQKGRKAAEKNAYSLLRKRRYGVAAAFFLLAEPPMLKTALEVIVTNMGDLPLALCVARLVEGAPKMGGVGGADGLTIGSKGLSGMM